MALGAKVRQLPFYNLQSWMKTNILLFPSDASYCTRKGLTLVTGAPSFLFLMHVLLNHRLAARVTPSLRSMAVKTRGAQDERGCRILIFVGHAATGFSVP